MQIFDQLPEGLAIAVLAASAADLNEQLSLLPGRFHQLAIEAAFPSISSHKSLTLSISSALGVNAKTAYAVLYAAITASSDLKNLDMSCIPVKRHEGLLQLISAACMSPIDVRLSFSDDDVPSVSELNALAQIGEALSCNTALTSLSLTFGNPRQIFNLDTLL
jgi:hypothetical protein